eukprot:SAG31_NODE_2968_length_4839_cov_2.825738_2_plen_628_part_00
MTVQFIILVFLQELAVLNDRLLQRDSALRQELQCAITAANDAAARSEKLAVLVENEQQRAEEAETRQRHAEAAAAQAMLMQPSQCSRCPVLQAKLQLVVDEAQRWRCQKCVSLKAELQLAVEAVERLSRLIGQTAVDSTPASKSVAAVPSALCTMLSSGLATLHNLRSTNQELITNSVYEKHVVYDPRLGPTVNDEITVSTNASTLSTQPLAKTKNRAKERIASKKAEKVESRVLNASKSSRWSSGRHSTANELLARHRSKKAMDVVTLSHQRQQENQQTASDCEHFQSSRRSKPFHSSTAVERFQAKKAREGALECDTFDGVNVTAATEKGSQRFRCRSRREIRHSTANELLMRHRSSKKMALQNESRGATVHQMHSTPSNIVTILQSSVDPSTTAGDDGNSSSELTLLAPPSIFDRVQSTFDPAAFSDDDSDIDKVSEPPPLLAIQQQLRQTFDPSVFSDEDSDDQDSGFSRREVNGRPPNDSPPPSNASLLQSRLEPSAFSNDDQVSAESSWEPDYKARNIDASSGDMRKRKQAEVASTCNVAGRSNSQQRKSSDIVATTAPAIQASISVTASLSAETNRWVRLVSFNRICNTWHLSMQDFTLFLFIVVVLCGSAQGPNMQSGS